MKKQKPTEKEEPTECENAQWRQEQKFREKRRLKNRRRLTASETAQQTTEQREIETESSELERDRELKSVYTRHGED